MERMLGIVVKVPLKMFCRRKHSPCMSATLRAGIDSSMARASAAAVLRMVVTTKGCRRCVLWSSCSSSSFFEPAIHVQRPAKELRSISQTNGSGMTDAPRASVRLRCAQETAANDILMSGPGNWRSRQGDGIWHAWPHCKTTLGTV